MLQEMFNGKRILNVKILKVVHYLEGQVVLPGEEEEDVLHCQVRERQLNKDIMDKDNNGQGQ